MTEQATAPNLPMIEYPPMAIPKHRQARLLYFMEWKQADIAERLDVDPATITYWKNRDKWDEAGIFERMEASTEARYMFLLGKEKKSNSDYKELDQTIRVLDKFFFPKEEQNRSKRATARLTSKDFNIDEFKEQVYTKFMDEAFPYQRKHIENAHKNVRDKTTAGTSILLKSRQIGFTKTLGEAALLRLAQFDNNQIYIAASLRQAYQSREYIKTFVQDIVGYRMSGTETLRFWDDKKIDFLPSNVNTAQGYTGDVTLDEFLWMLNFADLSDFVKGCATLDQYGAYYSSTASYKIHPGYKFWIGEDYNLTHKNDKIVVDHAALKNGKLCQDGIFRQIITLEDAVKNGNTLITPERIKRRYSEDRYRNMYGCEFIDQSASTFDANNIMRCMVDSFVKWNDFFLEARADKPFGNKEVILGYDPAETLDMSSCVVIALPTTSFPLYRILEKFNWLRDDYDYQVAQIKTLTERYNVIHMGMDGSGPGLPIARQVKQFFPYVTDYRGSMELKSFLIIEAKKHFRNKTIEFDNSWRDVLDSFLSIKPMITRSGNVVYGSDRKEDTYHADLAWSIMYALGFIKPDGKSRGDSKVTATAL